MGFSTSSKIPCQIKSESLRTNEEFVRLYNDVTEARRNLHSQRSRVGDDVEVLRIFLPFGFYDFQWQRLQESIRYVDHLLKRAEKNAQFPEFLPEIVLQFERKFFTELRHARSGLVEDRYCIFGVITLMLPDPAFLLEDLLEVFAESVTSGLESALKLVVSALALLSFVYQYLIGCVDKGGAKTYSPGSFLFRLIFVAIVLFLGSYVWIKSRQASFTANRRKRKLGDQSDVPEGVYRRPVKDSSGSVTHYKFEPRFKPRREKLVSGTSLEFNCLSLGSYDTPREAYNVRHIAAVLYEQEEGRPVQFEDGPSFPFPSVTEQENCPPSGKEKALWVTYKTKELYGELLREKARRLQQRHPAVETGSHHGHVGEASRRDPSTSAPAAPSPAIELTCFTPPHGGDGGVEQATTSKSHGLGQEPPIARGVFSGFYSNSDWEQIFSSMLQREENDIPAMDDLDQIECDFFDTDRICSFNSTPVPPQSSALDIPTTAIVQGLEVIEPHFNSATAITFQQLESLPEQVPVQQHKTCQEKRPEEYAGSNVELQQKLLESEKRNSELEQKLRQSVVENEKLKSMFHQVTKLMSASNLDGHPVDTQ